MKNAIITGATSFIGVHLINELLINDYYVTAVVRPNSHNINRLPTNKRITVIELDTNDIKLLPNKVKDAQYEVFYHLSWDGVRATYRDDILLQLNNYNNSIKAMQTANILKCNVFVGSGSQAEYGKCLGKITEEYIPNPLTEYGKAKLNTYEKLKSISENMNIKFIWTRLFSVYGIYDHEKTLVMSALKKLLNNEDLELTECNQRWDYIQVEDVARAMYLLGTSDCESGIYNIASGNSKQLKEFVIDIKRITNSKSQLKFGAINYGSEGVISLEPAIDKLKRNIDWSCKVSFDDGITKLSKYLIQEGYL